MWSSVMRAVGAGYAALVVALAAVEFGSWVFPILLEPFAWEFVATFALLFAGVVLVIVDRTLHKRPGPWPLIGAPEPPEPPEPPLSRRRIALITLTVGVVASAVTALIMTRGWSPSSDARTPACPWPIVRKPDGVRCVSHAWWVQVGLGGRRGALGFFSVFACVVACCLRPLQPPTDAAAKPDRYGKAMNDRANIGNASAGA